MPLGPIRTVVVITGSFVVGAAVGAAVYAWHGNTSHGLNAQDRDTASTAYTTIEQLCLRLPTAAPLPLTTAQRQTLHDQTAALIGVIERNPDYHEEFVGNSVPGLKVGWVPQIQFAVQELAYCRADADMTQYVHDRDTCSSH